MSYGVDPLDTLDLNTTTFISFVKELGVPVTSNMLTKAIRNSVVTPVLVAGRNRFSRRMALKWIEAIGVPVDWQRAAAERKREAALEELAETETALAQLA